MPAKDPEKRAAYQRAYREKNREKARENQRRWQEQNKEKVKDYHRRYYQENRERLLAREAERYRESDEVRKRKSDRAKQWAAENPEEYRKKSKKSWVRLKYDMEVEEYDSIIAKGCAICGTHEGRLVLDHDHANGNIRDALCATCNAALGHFQDDPARMRAAARYIERHRET